ncbi:phage terminase large subunit family protein [Rhodospirillum centenum]|uniref:Phage terminase large subunit (GpA) n=1 Tax=Rhodospirillum centenum (strain ATCC 51521 / SW) TaxID=414684 RepID=B6IMM9_RHOCS|nr:phage terminase large subunit family protein [Rhodospirillum centenum]ACI98695.1 phage terminase large subunit (GpA) [Rhodospirillum centenum SW]
MPLDLPVSPLVAEAASGWFAALRPPPRLSLAEWAEQHARLYDGSVFRPYPYQRDILDAMTDPAVHQVTVMKSARVGYTQMLSAALGYFIAQRPSKIMVVQPTTEDGEDYSKDTVDPLRDWPVLAGLLSEAGAKQKGDTIKRKAFPGGSLRIAGANSPRAFRRIDLDVLLFDEVDGYPPAAGREGDQIALGLKRLTQSLRPLAVLGSTPLLDGESKIAAAFAAGTMERYHVPCPHCGEFQALRWGDGTGAGMRWSDGDPETAHYVCANGCPIDESHKLDMLERGRWVAEAPFRGHRSFHIWSAYCPLPGAAWPKLVAEFLAARKDRERLQVFTNTVLGETWVDRGEAPDWQRLYDRREVWEPGTVPAGGLFLTAGADVQRDRIEVSVWAWGRGRESWLVDHRVLMGDPFDAAVWRNLSALLAETFPHAAGPSLPITMVAIDAGDGVTMEAVKVWVRTAGPRVMAVKGSSQALAPILGQPSASDVNHRGKKIANGVKLWPVGSAAAKSEFYGCLRLPRPGDGEPCPAGYVHIPMHIGEETCKQLVAEHRVTRGGKGRARVTAWEKLRDRNEALDCRVYARAAAARQGLDRLDDDAWSELERTLGVCTAPAPSPAPSPPGGPPPPPAAPFGPIRSRYIHGRN